MSSEALLPSPEEGAATANGAANGTFTNPFGAATDEEEEEPVVEEELEIPEDIAAGFVIPLGVFPPMKRLYPVFQGGYSTASLGNPLPARLAEHCASSSSSMSGEALEELWKDLMNIIGEPVTKYHTRRLYIVASMALLVIVAVPFLIPLMIHSSSTRGVSIFILLLIAGLFGGVQFLKCATQEPLQMAIKDITELHSPGWKENARVTLKLVQPQQACCSSCPSCCCGGCFGSGSTAGKEEMILLFQKYVPVSERRAQIAFV
ncbi:expressed unknown protein [Seminavis robusta]|uniref:Transmembrane protein n=1 Tax=Seminavis robusta TaxID=568900 RepID=A0A9N8DKY3_9STRA|nr:expressed unknown protein [Seminavis robusta]|eukprot:Sro201_g085120.1 n/a (262) ;mRNA; f:57802-58587